MSRRNLIIGAGVLLVLCCIVAAAASLLPSDTPVDEAMEETKATDIVAPTEDAQPTNTTTPTDNPEEPDPTDTPQPTEPPKPTDEPQPTDESTESTDTAGPTQPANGEWEDGSLDAVIINLGFETSYLLYNPNNQILLVAYRDPQGKGNICSAPFEGDHAILLVSVKNLLEDGYPQLERVFLEQVDTEDLVLSRLTWVPSEDRTYYEGPERLVEQCRS